MAQNGAKSGFEMCFGLSTLGAGAKTRLESRIKELTPRCSLCDVVLVPRHVLPHEHHMFVNGIRTGLVVRNNGIAGAVHQCG